MFNSIFPKDGFSSLNRWWWDVSHQIEPKWITVTRFDAMYARSRQHDWPRHMSLLWHGSCPSMCNAALVGNEEIKKDGKSSRKRVGTCSRPRQQHQRTEEMKGDWFSWPAETHRAAFWQSAMCACMRARAPSVTSDLSPELFRLLHFWRHLGFTGQ